MFGNRCVAKPARKAYPKGMSAMEKACVGAWGVNLCCAAACNMSELGYAAGVLLVFTATFFLFASPLHAALAMCVWILYRLESRAAAPGQAVSRACSRLICAESLAFWALYWGMAFDLVPLHIRL